MLSYPSYWCGLSHYCSVVCLYPIGIALPSSYGVVICSCVRSLLLAVQQSLLCVQEVTDLVDKVSLAMDLVKSELKHIPAQVTVTIVSSPEAAQCQHAAVDAAPTQQQGHQLHRVQIQAASGQQQQRQGAEQSTWPKQVAGLTQQQRQQRRAGQQFQGAGRRGDLTQQQHGTQKQQCGQERAVPSQDSQHRLVLVELLSDNYQDVMTETVHEVESELVLCRQLLQQCQESFSCLVSFYGENAQAFANDAVFWSDVTTFVMGFTACQKQLRKQIQVHCCPIDLLLASAWRLLASDILLSWPGCGGFSLATMLLVSVSHRQNK